MAAGNPIILFDGVCNLCSATVSFVLKRDKKKQFGFVALQSERGGELIRKFDIPEETDSVVLIAGNRFYFESDAVIEIARLLPAPWKWMELFRIIPVQIRNSIYRWIGKNRYRWFGKRNSCRIIKP